MVDSWWADRQWLLGMIDGWSVLIFVFGWFLVTSPSIHSLMVCEQHIQLVRRNHGLGSSTAWRNLRLIMMKHHSLPFLLMINHCKTPWSIIRPQHYCPTPLSNNSDHWKAKTVLGVINCYNCQPPSLLIINHYYNESRWLLMNHYCNESLLNRWSSTVVIVDHYESMTV